MGEGIQQGGMSRHLHGIVMTPNMERQMLEYEIKAKWDSSSWKIEMQETRRWVHTLKQEISEYK